MNNKLINQMNDEYQSKVALGENIEKYYVDKTLELNLKDFSRMKAYLKEFLTNQSPLFSRDIVFSHLDFEYFANSIFNKQPFTVVSGLNPSSPLHLGHKALFDLLLYLQKLGADIFIPITNDESYLDGKASSLSESRRIAYEEIIPSIVAFGFDPKKTKIFVLSDYPDIYNFAIHLSKFVTNKQILSVFGEEALNNSGKAFYRSAVQLAQILLPQLSEFGGSKRTLIPVGIDQHPYILVARDIAKKVGLIPPSELVFKFQNSLLNPFQKMSGSQPKTAIYLSDTPEVIRKKIQHSFTGSVSSLDVHRQLGGVPEACSAFSLLRFHHPDDNFVTDIYNRYKSGQITMKELKEITAEFIIKLVENHQIKKSKVKDVSEFILKKPLSSLLC